MKTYKYFIVALCAIIACSCLDGHHKKRLGDNDKFSHHEDMHEEIEMLDTEVTTVTKGEVIYEGNSNITWDITAEETTTEGLFIITFNGTIKSGYHGYGMADYSAPYFEFDNAEIVGDIIEPITPVEQPDEFGGTSYIYYDNATYIQTIKASPGKQVTGYINATICTNDSSQCTCNLATFTIQMPGKATKKLKEKNTLVDTNDIKYSDFLYLPYQLKGHFDLEEAVEDAKAQNKPIFVDVTGHACNNCREMETKVWGSEKVLPMLQNDFIICALYVDDKTKVDGGERLGSKNIKLAQERWGVNAQPGYILLSPDGKTVLAGPRGYDTDIDAFVEFLNQGKNGVK